MTTCPSNHDEYPSQMVADNMVTVHKLKHPKCYNFSSFPCGDHWHVGHELPGAGRWCKAHQESGKVFIRKFN